MSNNSSNILQFWNKHRSQLPKMACIVRQLLSVPATSTASKSFFLHVGLFSLKDDAA